MPPPRRYRYGWLSLVEVIDEGDKEAVLRAFAQSDASKIADRYTAAVDAWCDRHPDHARPYAAQRAVQIVLDARYTRLMDVADHE